MSELASRDFNSVEFRALSGENGTRKAQLRAAVVGNIDAHRSVFFPGSFDGAKEDFIRGGHLLVGHNWSSPNVGMIEAVRMEGRSLVADVHFYSTSAGNDMYQVMLERSAAGKSMGASIGFQPGETQSYPSGSALLKDAERAGYDLSLFDASLEGEQGAVVGIKTVAALREVSLVVAPSNPLTESIAVRAMTARNELQAALEAVSRVAKRFEEIREMRIADGRELSNERKAELAAVKMSLDSLSAVLADLTFDASLRGATEDTERAIAGRALAARLTAAEIDLAIAAL